MSTKPLGVALIGAGRIGSFHAETVARRLADADFVAIADPAPGAADRLADQLGVAKRFTDVAKLLADPAVEAVVIATPRAFTRGSSYRRPKPVARIARQPRAVRRPIHSASIRTPDRPLSSRLRWYCASGSSGRSPISAAKAGSAPASRASSLAKAVQ